MLSGQTRAVLERKARAGADSQTLLREKRMGDLAWQMTVATQKLQSCPREKRYFGGKFRNGYRQRLRVVSV